MNRSLAATLVLFAACAQVPGRTQGSLDPPALIRGRVVFPEGTPNDERCVVVLEAHGPIEDDTMSVLVALWPDLADWQEVGRQVVGADGGFVLEWPAEAGGAWLRLEGDYLLCEPKVIDDEDSTTIELRPELGTHVTFELVPLSPDSSPSVLIGRRVMMMHLPRRTLFHGRSPSMGFEVLDDLTMEGHALPPDQRWEVGRDELRPFVVAGRWDPELVPGTRQRVEIPLDLAAN